LYFKIIEQAHSDQQMHRKQIGMSEKTNRLRGCYWETIRIVAIKFV